MRIYLVTFPPHQIIRFSCRRYFWWYFSGFLFICTHVSLITSSTHIFPDELGDGAGQHEAGDGAAHDVEEGVHDPRAGGGFDRRTEGTAERARRRSTATAYLRRRRRGRRQLSIHTNTRRCTSCRRGGLTSRTHPRGQDYKSILVYLILKRKKIRVTVK